MTDKSPREVERMLDKAKRDNRKDRKARRVVEDTYTKAMPQREHEYRERQDD